MHILSEEVSKRAENIKGVTTFKNPLFSSSFSSQFDDYTLNQLLSIFSCFFAVVRIVISLSSISRNN